MGIWNDENKYDRELEDELDREFERQVAIDEFLYEQHLREEEKRKEREGLFPGVTLNGHGIHDRDIPYYDDSTDDTDIENDKYSEYEDLPRFEKIR